MHARKLVLLPAILSLILSPLVGCRAPQGTASAPTGSAPTAALASAAAPTASRTPVPTPVPSPTATPTVLPTAAPTPTPRPTRAPVIDDILGRCPAAADVAAVDRDVRLTFEGDPTAGQLVCSAKGGSADLTQLQERAYQAILMMKRIQFDQPLPWTDKPLYDWFVANVKGVRFRSDIGSSFCCDPQGVINIQTQNLAALSSQDWIDRHTGAGLQGLMAVMVHEARHSEGFPHTCASNDRTLAEMGAWGVQYQLLLWLADHTDPAFMAYPAGRGVSTSYYRDTARYDAGQILKTRFCIPPATP